MTPFEPGEGEIAGDTAQTIGGLRDGLRSARFWHELLSHDERQILLLDIARISLILAGDLWGNRTWHDGDVPSSSQNRNPAIAPCPVERLAFLQAAWPRMEIALRQIEADPPHILQADVRLVETARAHRVSPKHVLQALRVGGEFVPVSPSANVPLAHRLGGKLPRRIYESVVSPCFDTATNRAVKTVIARFAHDLKTIAILAAQNNLPDAAREAERLRLRVRRRLITFPWRDLPPASGSTRNALLVSLLPPSLRHSAPHQRVHDTFRQYAHDFTLDWNAPVFTLPAQKTWLLYEMWCVFAVADVLRGLGFVARTGDFLATAPFGLSCRLATDKASRLTMETPATHQTVTLTYNRFFPRAGDADHNGWHSRGRALRPDITLQCGASGRLLVLDAKFKTYTVPGWEGADVQQMHSYRDAIAHGNQRNVVQAAWLLYAGGHAGDSRRPVIAYPTAAYDAPLGNGEVGAICLRPNQVQEPCDALSHLIRVFLRGGKH